MSEFRKEHRYYVIKRRDFEAAMEPFSTDGRERPPRIPAKDYHAFMRVLNACENARIDRKAPGLECVVVEHDWRIYDSVWSLVEMEHNWNQETKTATPKDSR